ncbi:hypothetical protein ACFWTE_25250 [Nocardiopsis sp. NPDC058631]|uniref:hypothetical protein n=1 Tax=Nocardiopsis sp. NPDC058631 TaxID=3346566 RepID=UPI00364CE6A9
MNDDTVTDSPDTSVTEHVRRHPATDGEGYRRQWRRTTGQVPVHHHYGRTIHLPPPSMVLERTEERS